MIEFFFDCSSPWTWLAFRNIQPMARDLGAEIEWRPILVGGVFNAVNPSVYEFRERGVPAKQAYLKKDLADWARHCGVKILFPPSVFPVNSVKAMRECLLLEPQGKLRAVRCSSVRGVLDAGRSRRAATGGHRATARPRPGSRRSTRSPTAER